MTPTTERSGNKKNTPRRIITAPCNGSETQDHLRDHRRRALQQDVLVERRRVDFLQLAAPRNAARTGCASASTG